MRTIKLNPDKRLKLLVYDLPALGNEVRDNLMRLAFDRENERTRSVPIQNLIRGSSTEDFLVKIPGNMITGS